MKKRTRNLVIDLTSFLDVILILMFLTLLMNTGEMEDYKSQLDESEELRLSIEHELGLAQNALIDKSDRLDALSDWDNERLGLLDEIGALSDWKAAAEGAIRFITIDYHATNEPREISILVESEISGTVEFIWDGNNITNDIHIQNEVNALLSDAIISGSSNQPLLIMLDYTEMRNREFNLINSVIMTFIELENARNEFNIYYSHYRN